MTTAATPLQTYQRMVTDGVIVQDQQQLDVIERFEQLYHQLIKRHHIRQSTLGKIRRKIKPRPPIKGVYLWGSVGAGKTFLMDILYHCLPVPKMRMHFHAFMQRIHRQLTELQGTKNPLATIAYNIAEETLIICFDEFFVSNIVDAMLLGELFTHLFARGVTLVASSNIAPDNLYAHGLQRERFLPAITLIKRYTDTIQLSSHTDYRLRHIEQAGVFYSPLNAVAQENMEQSFKHFSQNRPFSTEDLIVFNRPIAVIKRAANTIWFEFLAICGRPRSQQDYLTISKQFHTVLISNIPILQAHERDLVTSFVNLIDVFYDAHVRVVISAAAPVEQLYTDKALQIEYERTQSRLIEMQSSDYFHPGTHGPELTPL